MLKIRNKNTSHNEDKQREMLIMKHIIGLKLPKLFGKRKIEEDESRVTTEIEVEDEKISKAVLIGVPLAALAVGYMVGYNKGISKVATIIVVK